MTPFHVGMWPTPFAVGDMDRPCSTWEYEKAPFKMGIWNVHCLFGNMD